MKPNNGFRISKVMERLDSVIVRIDAIEKLLNNIHHNDGLTEDERKAKKEWVCQTCGKSTYGTDYDYLVHPKLHLGCALEEEKKGKGIKEQYHEASSRLYKARN
jgi:ribosomal protein L37AE/L43A